MYVWHLMIYKANFDQAFIDAFFANIYQQRDQSGLHFKKMTIQGDTKQVVLATLWFESENKLDEPTLQQIVKFMYTQLFAGMAFELPTFARILREDLKTLGIEFMPVQKGEYNVTFWGVPMAKTPKK